MRYVRSVMLSVFPHTVKLTVIYSFITVENTEMNKKKQKIEDGD